MRDIIYELQNMANELNRYGEIISRDDWQTCDGEFYCRETYCYNGAFYTVNFINGTVVSINKIGGNKNES